MFLEGVSDWSLGSGFILGVEAASLLLDARSPLLALARLDLLDIERQPSDLVASSVFVVDVFMLEGSAGEPFLDSQAFRLSLGGGGEGEYDGL